MKKLSILSLLLSVVLFSCNNDDEVAVITETQEATMADEVYAEQVFEEIDDLSYEGSLVAEGGRIENDARFACADISFVDNTITIDFGDGCEGPRGRIRAGRIIITRTGPYFQEGAQHVLTLDNFSIDGISVEGTRTITNQGLNDQDYSVFNVTLSGGRVVLENGTEILRNSDFTRTWVRGNNAGQDELHLIGSASGTNRNGVNYQMNILEPLIFTRACRWQGFPMAVSGVKQFTTDNATFTVDYGNGECDNEVVVSSNGASRTIQVSL